MVERFGIQRADRGLSPRDEIDHLATNPRLENDDGEESQCDE